jgi:hypothetical protein
VKVQGASNKNVVVKDSLERRSCFNSSVSSCGTIFVGGMNNEDRIIFVPHLFSTLHISVLLPTGPYFITSDTVSPHELKSA